MRSYCMIRQNQKLKSYRISPRNYVISYFLCDSWYTSAGIELSGKRILYDWCIESFIDGHRKNLHSDPNVIVTEKGDFTFTVTAMFFCYRMLWESKALRNLFPLTCPCLRRRFLIRIPNLFFRQVNRNWDWTNIRSVPAREWLVDHVIHPLPVL